MTSSQGIAAIRSTVTNYLSRLFLVAACGVTILVPSAAHAEANAPEKVLTTVGGVLQAGPQKGEDWGEYVTLNSKPVFYKEDNKNKPFGGWQILLKRKFRINGNDVVLAQVLNEGACCNSVSSLYLVTITPTKKAIVSEEMEADEDGTADVIATANALTIKIKTHDGRRSKTNTWSYSNGQVLKTK